jgi:hypothetical protein
MAQQTAVNDQITDSITQANTEVVGVAPANAMGNLYQSFAQALSLAALNSTTAQQQSSMSAQATTTMGVTTLYSIDTATDAVGASDILDTLNDPKRPRTSPAPYPPPPVYPYEKKVSG